tara:strand:- start:108 stop:1040 length:933 start_codon:yes stop_codon:yes gene_type:complete
MAKANKQTHVVDDGQVDLDFDEYEETVVTTGGEEAEEQVASGSVEEEEEVEQYSESVQKRINRLTKKMRDAERNEQEAIGYARSVQAESEKIKTRLQQVDHGYMSEYSGRLAAEEKAAEEALKQAVRSADPDATVSSQSRLTAIHVQKAKLEEAKRVSEARQQVQQQQAQVQQQPQPQQQQQQRDPRAEEWARKNKWFSMAQTPQRDVAMTGAARAIHEVLVEEEGFDPTSDEYYDEIDLRIRDMFPDNFSGSEPAARTNGTARRGAQTVAGASRSRTGRTRRQVKLSPSQRSIAAKLGVPESEYAKYVK